MGENGWTPPPPREGMFEGFFSTKNAYNWEYRQRTISMVAAMHMDQMLKYSVQYEISLGGM